MNPLLIATIILNLGCILMKKINKLEKNYNNNKNNNISSNQTMNNSYLNDLETRIFNSIDVVNSNIININSNIININSKLINLNEELITVNASATELGYEVNTFGEIIFRKKVIFQNDIKFENQGEFEKEVTFKKPVRITDRTADAFRVDGEISVGADDNFRASIKVEPPRNGMRFKTIVFGRHGDKNNYHGFTIRNAYGNNHPGEICIITKSNATFALHKLNVSGSDTNTNYQLNQFMLMNSDKNKIEIKRTLEMRNHEDNNNVAGTWYNDGHLTCHRTVKAPEFKIKRGNEQQQAFFNYNKLKLGDGKVVISSGEINEYCVNDRKPFIKIGNSVLKDNNSNNKNELAYYKTVNPCSDKLYLDTYT